VTIPAGLLGIGVLGVGIFPGNIHPQHPLFAFTALWPAAWRCCCRLG
jgi:hypothetical protein